MKYMLFAAMGCWFFMVAPAARGQTPPPPDSTVTLEQLLVEALENNPELQAFEANHRAVAARIPQMSSLDNPMFEVEIEEAPSGDVFNTSQWKYVNYGLRQTLPFPGKLAKAKKLAEIEAEHAHHDYEEKVLEITQKVKMAYYELYMIQRGLEINQENVNLMTQFLNLAKVRYAVGQLMNQDVLKSNVELARLANGQITLQQQDETAKAMLNVLINRSPQSPLGQAVFPERELKAFDLTELQRLALGARPMLRHDSLSVKQSRVANSLARRQYWPDFDLSLRYVTSPFDGFRGWTAMAGATLPFSLWSIKKQRGRVEETAADIRMKEALFNHTRNMILFEVRDALAKVQSAQRMLELYRATVLPQAEQALQVTLTNYQTRQTDFLMLLDSYRMLQMFKMEYYEALAKREMSLAELERAVGKKLDE